MIFWIVKIILYLPSLILFPTKVINKKNLPKQGRLILICNHQTINDAPLIGLRLNRRFNFMAKQSLFNNKFFGWFLRNVGAYPVNPNSSDITSVKTTLRLLKAEKAVCIFPEGQRVISDSELEFKNGVAMFALKTKSPIIPTYFTNKTVVFKRNKLIVGEPFNLSQIEEFKDKKVDKELLNKATEYITEQMNNLK